MIDRIQRDAARSLLRSFIEGAITNDEFDGRFPSVKHDSALEAIKANVWMLYSDLHCHRLTGEFAPNAATRDLLERCVLFLDSNLEFEWPVPKISLTNIFPKWLRRSALTETESFGGDEEVWPFFRRSDYEFSVLKRH